jgi:hypothetical protein
VSVIDVRAAITQAHHTEWARVVAALTRRFGDLDIAEEAAAEAFATAVERWPQFADLRILPARSTVPGRRMVRGFKGGGRAQAGTGAAAGVGAVWCSVARPAR